MPAPLFLVPLRDSAETQLELELSNSSTLASPSSSDDD
jgi:hypothetical protein